MADYHVPIASFGKSVEAPDLGQEVASGATTITKAATFGSFTAGNPLFISTNASLVNQYLGVSTAAAAGEISFTIPIETTYSAGDNARVWEPSTFWLPVMSSGAFDSHDEDLGTTIRRTRGAVVRSYNVSDPLQIKQFNVPIVDLQDFSDWSDFVKTDRDNGTKPFSWSFYDRYEGGGSLRTVEAKVTGGRIVGASVTNANGKLIQFGIGRFIITDDSFILA